MPEESTEINRPFCRVLSDPDAWTSGGSSEARTDDFRGRYDDISVAHTTNCSPELVVASFLGARGGLGPLSAHYYGFLESEVIDAGGRLRQSPAEPPWPPEYNDAHHDIYEGQQSVARKMSRLCDLESGRVVDVPRKVFLSLIASLLTRNPIEERFRKKGWQRFSRLFREERDLWIDLAQEHLHLLDNKDTQSEIRKIYRDSRAGWENASSEQFVGRIAV